MDSFQGLFDMKISSLFHRKANVVMKWTAEHDLELVREMLAERPFDYPKGSREIGVVWKKIMSNLNEKKEIKFNLNTIRAVRERYHLLEAKFKRNLQKELNASGIDVEPTEFDNAMEDLVEYFENQEANAEIEKEAKLQNMENEKAKAEDVRQKALETFSETKKRKGQDKVAEKPSKRRLSAVQFLQEKAQKDMALRKEELELRRKELELKEEQLKMQNKQQGDLMKALFSLINKNNNV